RVPEEDHEALDQRELDEHEAHADSGEVHDGRAIARRETPEREAVVPAERPDEQAKPEHEEHEKERREKAARVALLGDVAALERARPAARRLSRVEEERSLVR